MMNLTRHLILALVVALLAVAGCAQDDGAELAGRDSGIHGVPIPSTAERDGDAGWTVPGSSFEEVVEFYEREMPEGQDWRGWAWCDTGGGETIHAHIYARPGRRVLAVAITNDDPPAIVIGADRSGPC